MPKAILAMRSYPATLALAVLLFLLTLIITTGSLGKVRSGGDGGDGGSGMGGTGKSGEFGGSGFGGTGGPSPFFTVTDPVQDEHERPQGTDTEPAPLVELPVIEQPSTLIAQDPQPAATEPATVKQNPVLDVIERHPLVEETRQEIAQDQPALPETPAVTEVQESIQLVDASPERRQTPTVSTPSEQPPTDGKLAAPTLEEPAQIATAVEAQPAIPEAEKNAPKDVPQLAETITVTLDPDADTEEANRERPERIQRPELPPFQRITPVQRPTLLPPRVQPMRI